MRKTKVSFTSDNQKIVGTFLVPGLGAEELLPGVVFYHGRGSSQKGYISRAEAVVKQGIICLTFDFRGWGKSEGNFPRLTIEDGISDALAAFDFLDQQKQVDENRLGICGRSLGGYLAVLVSTKRKVKSLVLSAPAIYKDDWIDGAYPSVPIREIKNFLNGNNFEVTRAIKAIKKFKGNLFVIGNERDKVIPEAVVKAYYNAAVNARHKEMAFIKGAGHRLDKPEFNEEFKKLIAAWFVKTL